MKLFSKSKPGVPSAASATPTFQPIDRANLLAVLDRVVNQGENCVIRLREPRGAWTYAFQGGGLTHASGGAVRGARQAFDLLWEFQHGEINMTGGVDPSLSSNLYIDKGRLLDLLRRSQAALTGPHSPYIPPDQQRPIQPVRPQWPQPGMGQRPAAPPPGWNPAPYPPPGYPAAPPQGYPAPPPAPQGYPAAAPPRYPAAPPRPQAYPAPAQGQPAAPPPGYPAAYPPGYPAQPGPPPGGPPAQAGQPYPGYPVQAQPYPPAQPMAQPLPQQMAPPPRMAPPPAPPRPQPRPVAPSFSVPPMPLPKPRGTVNMPPPPPAPPPPPMAAPVAPAGPIPDPNRQVTPVDELKTLRATLVSQVPAAPAVGPPPNWNVRGPGRAVAPPPAPKKAKGVKPTRPSPFRSWARVQLITFLLWACERRYSPDDHWTVKDAFEVATLELRDQFLGAFLQSFQNATKGPPKQGDEFEGDQIASGRTRGRSRGKRR